MVTFNSGADTHFISKKDWCQAGLPILQTLTKKVGVANGGTSKGKYITQLPFQQLSAQAMQADTLGFWWRRYHDSDHCAVVATINLGGRRLTEYSRKRQEFWLKLPPVEQQDNLTRAFEALKDTCKEPETTKAHWHDWMDDSMWLLIKQRTSLRQAGRLCQPEGRRMQRAIHAALKRDRAARTAQVGKLLVAKLAKRNVHEAFRHLKGWYREASETQVRPCFQTMERQTAERVELYRRRDSPGLPIVLDHAEMLPTKIRDELPDEEEI